MLNRRFWELAALVTGSGERLKRAETIYRGAGPSRRAVMGFVRGETSVLLRLAIRLWFRSRRWR